MKNGIFAIYLGKEYTFGENKEGKTILYSTTNINDVEQGFEPCEPFIYGKCSEEVVCLKYVDYSEVEDYYTIKTKAIYEGYEFEVVEEKGDKISIVTMTGDYRNWLNLGKR